jgi:hypothetical protein
MTGHSRVNQGIQIGCDLNTQEYRLIQFLQWVGINNTD